MGVVDGYLADMARDGHGQLATGVDVTEEDVSDGFGTALAGHPGREHGRAAGRLGLDGERPTGDQHEHDRGPRRRDGRQQLRLAARQTEVHAVACLTACAIVGETGALAEHEHGDIRAPGRLDRRGDLVVAVGDAASGAKRTSVDGADAPRIASRIVGHAANWSSASRPSGTAVPATPRTPTHLEERLDMQGVGVVAGQVARAVGARPDDRDAAQLWRSGRVPSF